MTRGENAGEVTAFVLFCSVLGIKKIRSAGLGRIAKKYDNLL